MSEVVIRAEGLSKRYQLGERERYRLLRDVITEAASRPIVRLRNSRFGANRNGNTPRTREESIWALNGVSFEIKRGEIAGVIGRNGAGKSTLLKILSRITKPTKGHVEIDGRVGSLLEVGTGFHPELSGRENIYLNAAILGMRKLEVARKFDEIVSFAEVEKFIDTPVKRYSSGMYVRLAFAVAAHLETEILVVDEVLAVGDAQFQKKCLSKLQQVRTEGRTILFVSHNMAAVRGICETGFELNEGRIVSCGEINDVIDRYLAQVITRKFVEVETQSFVVNDVSINPIDGAEVIKTFAGVEIKVVLTAKMDLGDPGMYVGILTSENARIAGLDFKDFSSVPPIKAGERFELGFLIDELPLLGGTYQLEIHVKDLARHKIERVSNLFQFEVAETSVYGGRKLDAWFGSIGLRVTPIQKLAEVTDEMMAGKALAP
jgi:ABC-type polysaccharide/polyol phosphate transport system ATPase subunit